MTKIAWTDESWNPVTGCTPVSEGCKFCYAERLSKRFGWGWDVTLHPDRLKIPLRWRKPRMVFVPSMGDLFHEDVPDEFIDRVFAVMALAGCERQRCKGGSRCKHDEYESSGCWVQDEGFEQPTHTFQILTKRPERMRDYLRRRNEWNQQIYDAADGLGWTEMGDSISLLGWPLPNVWLGVSVENQARADERIPLLLDTPAAVRFVSAEPLLGPLNFHGSRWLFNRDHLAASFGNPGIDWVICGGESGGPPERRLVERCSSSCHRYGCDGCPDCNSTVAGWEPKPEALRWVRSIRDQCQVAGVPFFFKQWGPRAGQGTLLDGREHKEKS